MTTKRAIRVANGSGFLGDRARAMQELVEGGPIDVLTGDYLAELTLGLLGKQQQRDPAAGYAATFLRHLEPILATVLARGIKVVVNAGGLNPLGLSEAVRALGKRLGLAPAVATIIGDDLRPDLAALRAAGQAFTNLETGAPLPAESASAQGPFVRTANAYLGAWGIAAALARGADVVICPRVTDASLTIGPAAWWHGWQLTDWNALAGAAAAGHVIECGTQATGGNYSSFRDAGDLTHPGFPIAEIGADGDSVITKHAGTGGAVSVGTVTAQLVYEIGSTRYLNPDVTVCLDSIALRQEGPDRVAVSGVRGLPPPSTTKVAITHRGGFRNEMIFAVVGLEIDAKIALFERAVRAAIARPTLQLVLQRIGAVLGAAEKTAERQDEATVLLRVVASSEDEVAAGRAFSSGLVELALASYPGLFALAPPAPAQDVDGFWPALVPQSALRHRVVLPDGTSVDIAVPDGTGTAVASPPPSPAPPFDAGPRRRLPLGTLVDGRSGDKGSDANVGLWVRSDAAFHWLRAELSVEAFRALLPEAAGLAIERFELPNLRALNFLVHGLLSGGAAAGLRLDRQAKALAEFIRSRPFDLPVSLLDPQRLPKDAP